MRVLVLGGGDVGGGDDVGGGEESGAVVLANIVGTYTCGAGELVINADGTIGGSGTPFSRKKRFDSSMPRIIVFRS